MHGDGWDMINSSVPVNFKMCVYGKVCLLVSHQSQPLPSEDLKYNDFTAQMYKAAILIFGLRNTKIPAS